MAERCALSNSNKLIVNLFVISCLFLPILISLNLVNQIWICFLYLFLIFSTDEKVLIHSMHNK
jgi:hypothetical protein